ncbi:MAG: GTPase HflX [Candidatus Omnitrophota bacterium]
MEGVLLVTIKLKTERGGWPLEDIVNEMEELVSSCGAKILESMTYICERPTPNFFIGRGKAEEIAMLAQELGVQAVIFSRDLSGTQQRNLEEVIGRKTIDRTQLILDIFARHAHSPEGKMQVELAQLEYLLPRLVGKGIILSRLGGGIGTRGPGEQKLEVDRRRIRKKIDGLKLDLKQVMFHRKTIRKKRKDNMLPAIALVGYTNAGKSTLLNALTGSAQTVAGSLFTTLDPLSRGLVLPNGENIVLTDTVGFLHELPHYLIEAFKGTLEEVAEADLLIHVIDASHPRVYEHYRAVFTVLEDLGIKDKPIITALNKRDLLDDNLWLSHLNRDFAGSVLISARLKQNLGELLNKIQDNFSGRMACRTILIPHKRMDLVDLFYREGKVEKIDYLQKGIKIRVILPNIIFDKLLHSNDIEEVS